MGLGSGTVPKTSLSQTETTIRRDHDLTRHQMGHASSADRPMKRPIAFSIKHYDRVPKWVAGVHIAFADWLADNHLVLHTLAVPLTPSISMPTNDGRRCWGCFQPGEPPNIVLACGRPKIDGHLPDRGLQIGFLLGNFAHEFCHYEQWRDNKAANHRGVEDRVDGLLKRFRSYIEKKASDATHV